MKVRLFGGGKNRQYNITVLFFFVLICAVNQLNAQTRYVLSNSSSFNVKEYGVLPDKNYGLQQILESKSLSFVSNSAKATVGECYWIKLNIYNPYPNNEDYLLSVPKAFNYTLYQFNTGQKKWLSTSGGLQATNGTREINVTPCVLQKQLDNIIYLKIDLRNIKDHQYAPKPAVVFEKAVAHQASERFPALVCLFCCTVILSFAVYNLYIYFNLKYKPYLYYVVVQIGALFYLLGIHKYSYLFFPLRIYRAWALPDGAFRFIDLNDVMVHASVAIICWGFIQFARSYLQTGQSMPGYDQLLKLLSITYNVLITISIFVMLTGIYPVDIIPAANAFVICMIFACFGAGVVAHNRGIKAAKYFLAANLLPFLFMVGTAVYIILFRVSSPFLPEIAVLSQIFSFAVALVANVKLVTDELKEKEIEALQLENDVKITAYQRLLIEEENKNISLTVALEKERNDLLQQKLEANQRELVGNSLYIHQKNKLLAELSEQMQDMETLNPDARPKALLNMQTSLKGGMHLDDEWDKFKLHFEQVHPSFFKDLQVAHPNLTKYELRLYAYFHINLSTKEIAALLNIAPASVRQAKARLTKKMGL